MGINIFPYFRSFSVLAELPATTADFSGVRISSIDRFLDSMSMAIATLDQQIYGNRMQYVSDFCVKILFFETQDLIPFSSPFV